MLYTAAVSRLIPRRRREKGLTLRFELQALQSPKGITEEGETSERQASEKVFLSLAVFLSWSFFTEAFSLHHAGPFFSFFSRQEQGNFGMLEEDGTVALKISFLGWIN